MDPFAIGLTAPALRGLRLSAGLEYEEDEEDEIDDGEAEFEVARSRDAAEAGARDGEGLGALLEAGTLSFCW